MPRTQFEVKRLISFMFLLKAPQQSFVQAVLFTVFFLRDSRPIRCFSGAVAERHIEDNIKLFFRNNEGLQKGSSVKNRIKRW